MLRVIGCMQQVSDHTPQQRHCAAGLLVSVSARAWLCKSMHPAYTCGCLFAIFDITSFTHSMEGGLAWPMHPVDDRLCIVRFSVAVTTCDC
jgi:hypothetical protein